MEKRVEVWGIIGGNRVEVQEERKRGGVRGNRRREEGKRCSSPGLRKKNQMYKKL